MAGPPKINKHYESDDVIPEPQQEQGWKGRRPGDGLSSTRGGRAAGSTGHTAGLWVHARTSAAVGHIIHVAVEVTLL